MPKRAQIRALPTLGQGECFRIWQRTVLLLNNRNEIKFSVSGVEHEKFRPLTQMGNPNEHLWALPK